jgi:hypothetical protein
MPITASLGALSYNKTSLGEDYEYWYMRVTTNCTFTDITFDNDGAFYTTGITDQYDIYSGTTLVCRFKENNNYPTNISQYSYLYANEIAVGFTNPEMANVIRYNSYIDQITIAGSLQRKDLRAFPYYLSRFLYLNSIPKVLSTISGFAFQYPIPSTPGSNLVDRRYVEDLAIDTTDGTCYSIGPTVNGQPYPSVGYTKYSSAVLPITTLATNIDVTPGIGSTAVYIFNSSSITLDSNKDPVLCYTAQPTSSTSTRQTILRKASKTPTNIPGVYYYLPAIWQRKITGTTSFQSKRVRLDSSNNSYIVASDNTDSFLLKYNSSGTIQWQRKIANCTLNDLYVTSTGDSYLVGQNSSNNLLIVKYNSSGTIQWQTKMSGVTYTGGRIVEYGSALYIIGSATAIAFAVKLPNDGSIPGTGTYNIGGGTSITYSVATQTETVASLTDAALTDNNGAVAPLISTIGAADGPANISNTIINL